MRANAEIREEKAKRVADLEAARQDLYTWFSMHEDVKPFLFFNFGFQFFSFWNEAYIKNRMYIISYEYQERP